MENTKKFTGKAAAYSKYRPDYPSAYIDYLMQSNSLNLDSTIADIGSGTGILTQQLLDKGFQVHAVEPNDNMRIEAETKLKNYPNFISHNASAEHTGLSNNSIDLITAAQAFHWFDKTLFKIEAKRILKKDGNVSLVFNNRILSDPLIIENATICRTYCPGFKGFSNGIFNNNKEFQRVIQGFYKDKFEYREFEHPIPFHLDGFIGRNLSSSFSISSNDENYMNFIDALTELFYKYSKDGVLMMPNLTISYQGEI